MRSDFKDSAYTINKMIQFGTVKYGIVKQLKDRSRSDRDVTSDQEENESPSIPCSPVLNCKSISPEIQQTMFDHQNEDHNHNNNNSSENHDDDQRYLATNCSPVKSENAETQSDKGTNNRVSSSSLVYPEEREEHNEVESEIRLREQRKNSPQQSPLRVASLAIEKVKTLVYNDEEDQNMSNAEDDNAHPVTHEQNLEEDREQVCLQLRDNSHLHSIHPKIDNHNSIENVSFGNELSSSPPTLPQFPAAPVTLEAIQNMQMAIAQFAAKTLANGGADNEAAMKQLAFLQQTLFNLQQQQLFQIQLIQQLQSQLAMNQMKEGEDGNQEQNEKYDALDEEDKHCMEILSKPNSEEQNHKTVNESMDVEIRQSSETIKILEDEDEDIKDENDSLNNKQQEREIQQEQKLQKEKEVQKKQLQQQIRQEEQKLEETRRMQKDLLLSLPKQDENTPLPFGSDLASSIITNHDNPPSLDEPNSLEMLQKRAQEVLESASQGILAGNLADEFAFGKDKSGDGKNRNEPFFKHRCRYCGKVFGSDSALQIHIRSHTGERPFKCNVCGSRFTTKGNLKVHFQRHAQKFPHVPMNATPIPEHLDKFHPPLLEQMSPETSPQHQPQMPHPNVPVSLPLPFPHGAGFPGLPLYRPPLEILKTLGAPYSTPFFGPVMQPLPPKRDQEMPTDLRKPIVPPDSPKFKEETKDGRISLRIKEEEENESANTTPRRSKSVTPPLLPPPLPLQQIQQQQSQSQEQSQLHQQLHQQHQEHQQPPLPPVSLPEPIPPLPQMPPRSLQIPASLSIEELHDRLPLNFARSSPERRSPIRSPASIPRSPFLGPLKHEMTLIPRPHSNDNSWENFIEVSNTSETVKLKELMKNKKLTDPNQCVVCDRVLSCKSALQMHYRTHTGERPFKCRICGRAFTTKGNLKTHMAVHKIRPPMRNFHQCPVCHKKYSNALVLQQHIRLHTGEPTDLTPEQIQAAEIRDFPPSMMPGSFLNPFAFNFGMPGHNGTLGSESSQGDNDDNMDCSDDFDDDISDHISNGGDLDRPTSGDEMKGMLFEQKLKIENNRPKSEASTSSAPTSPISTMNKSSPAPSDISQGALDLTPKSIATISQQPPPPPNPALIPTRPPFGLFPNIPLFPPVSTTTQNMCSAMNSIAQSVMPSAPFNPLALSGVRGSTTCGICFKTFPCHSALEIHYRSHTKERPFKCSICDRGFTTKGNLKQHMLTHKIRDMEQDAYRNRAVKYMSGWKEGFE